MTGFRIGVFVVFARWSRLWLVRPLRPAGHRPAGRALRRGARAVAAGGDPERRRHRRGVAGRHRDRRARRDRRQAGGAGHREVPDDRGRPDDRPDRPAPDGGGAWRASRPSATLLLVVGPEFLRQGASALLVLSKSAEAASPYAITVRPATSRCPKGSDQTITAKLAGFRSNDVGVMVSARRATASSPRMPLVATGDADTFEGMLFDVKASLAYYVEADGVKSPTYTMKVVELPAVSRRWRWSTSIRRTPGCRRRRSKWAATWRRCAGTEVRVQITPTMTTAGGRLQLEPASVADLAVQPDGTTLTGSFKIAAGRLLPRGARRAASGEKVAASPKYTIDVIEDRRRPCPSRSRSATRRRIRSRKCSSRRAPRTTSACSSSISIYSVNGGAEKTVTLYGKGAKPLDEVSAGHTMYLEELGVKPGDFVSYYAKATDTDTVKGPKTTTSDIYFIADSPVQPELPPGAVAAGRRRRRWRRRPAAERGRRAVASSSGRSSRRRSTSIATRRRRRRQVQGEHGLRRAVAVEAARGGRRSSSQQMQQRVGAEGGENIQKILDALPKAIAEMRAAEDLLQEPEDQGRAGARAARAEAPAGRRAGVRTRGAPAAAGGGGGGGGGGGSRWPRTWPICSSCSSTARPISTRRRRARSSRAPRRPAGGRGGRAAAGTGQAAAAAGRAAAPRGPAAAERLGSGAAQRALADQMEEAARQLEQLRRDAERQGQQRQDLADAARRLQEAANAARQAAANGNNDNGAQAQQALQSIQEAQRLLQNNQSAQNEPGREEPAAPGRRTGQAAARRGQPGLRARQGGRPARAADAAVVADEGRDARQGRRHRTAARPARA